MTLELAHSVGPAGRVVGIDVDEGALAIARAAAQDAGLPAEFICADATAPPGRDAFDVVYYSATVRAHGGDPTIGPRLRALVDNLRARMLASGAATAAELDAIRADVECAARDPARVFYQARIHQVCGRRAL